MVVTNGLSVRQEHSSGWLFQHAKGNRLCLSFSCVQHDSVILEVSAVFVFTLLRSLLQSDTRKWDQKWFQCAEACCSTPLDSIASPRGDKRTTPRPHLPSPFAPRCLYGASEPDNGLAAAIIGARRGETGERLSVPSEPEQR